MIKMELWKSLTIFLQKQGQILPVRFRLVMNAFLLICHPEYVPSSLFLSPVTDNEIMKIVSELKSKNSAGVDKLGMLMVKNFVNSIPKPLLYICNSSLQLRGLFS